FDARERRGATGTRFVGFHGMNLHGDGMRCVVMAEPRRMQEQTAARAVAQAFPGSAGPGPGPRRWPLARPKRGSPAPAWPKRAGRPRSQGYNPKPALWLLPGDRTPRPSDPHNDASHWRIAGGSSRNISEPGTI